MTLTMEVNMDLQKKIYKKIETLKKRVPSLQDVYLDYEVTKKGEYRLRLKATHLRKKYFMMKQGFCIDSTFNELLTSLQNRLRQKSVKRFNARLI